MQIFVNDTYELMSKKAADDLLKKNEGIKSPLLCTASGDSPKGLYTELIKRIHKENIDISDWYFVSLDEWTGMNGNDEGSCRYHLNNDLFLPLNIKQTHIKFFDGRAADLWKECNDVENFIADHKKINVAIVGLGLNGHVGMNEPGTAASSRSHIADIDVETQIVGQKYFQNKQKLTHGLTLGLASLMDAENIMMLVSGDKKANIVKQIIEEEISENLPATILRRHNNFSVYLDKKSASLINNKNNE